MRDWLQSGMHLTILTWVVVGLAPTESAAQIKPRPCIENEVQCTLECYSAPADLHCPPGGRVCSSICGGGANNLRVVGAQVPLPIVLVASRLVEHGVGDVTGTEGFLEIDNLAEAPTGLESALTEWISALEEVWTGPGWYYSAFVFEGGEAKLVAFDPPSDSIEPITTPETGAAIQTLVWVDAYEAIVRLVEELGPEEVAKRALLVAGPNYAQNRRLFSP